MSATPDFYYFPTMLKNTLDFDLITRLNYGKYVCIVMKLTNTYTVLRMTISHSLMKTVCKSFTDHLQGHLKILH